MQPSPPTAVVGTETNTFQESRRDGDDDDDDDDEVARAHMFSHMLTPLLPQPIAQ